jgi:YbbR domain-containing protein
MHGLRRLFLDNWFIKLSSLVMASLLWMAIASESSSEIGLEVPLEYRNIPGDLEVADQTVNTVQVRLRGASNVVQEISARDVTTTIDLSTAEPGEGIFALSAQNVSAPFGIDVVSVTPTRVSLTLERTLLRRLPVTPVLDGSPAAGYEVGNVYVIPESVDVRGPESKVGTMESVLTVPIRIEGEHSDLLKMVELDPGESMVRPMNPLPVEVRVEIRPAP